VKKLFQILLTLVFFGCQSTVEKVARDTKYSAYELFGVEKRDLLRRRIAGAGDEQKEASESFGDALERLQQLYGSEGSDLEKQYRRLESAYEDATAEAEDVRESRKSMATVAEDLFQEWEREIGEIQSPDLKQRSRASLRDTRTRFQQLHGALRKSESRMEPVLAKLKDHVLFLKHNVNAQAVASLKKERSRIEGDIGRLLAEMNRSVAEAESFVRELE
jgi:ElaB/YqjD/DUF883 family membrane-anchored ribosome-binding protein